MVNAVRLAPETTRSTFSWNDQFSEKRFLLDDPALANLLKVAGRKGVLSLAGGLPAADLMPQDILSQAFSSVISAQGSSALQYNVPEGVHALREDLAALATNNGQPCAAENILVTAGSQQAIDLLAHVFVNPGQPIAITRPCYIGALQVFAGLNPEILEVGCDDEGPIVSELEIALQQSPKFFYVVSAFQNPSGGSVSEARGRQIVDLCLRYNVPILEDAAYRELYYNSKVVSLRAIESELLRDAGLSYDDCGMVLSLGTLSKVMAPGMRIGWVEAPTQVIAALTSLKQATDLHAGSASQLVASHFLRTHASEHWDRLRAAYRERRDRAADALHRYFGATTVRCTIPDGGFFLWLELADGFNATQALTRAVEEYGVAYVPGSTFFAKNPQHNTARVSFSSVPLDRLDEGFAQLARALS